MVLLKNTLQWNRGKSYTFCQNYIQKTAKKSESRKEDICLWQLLQFSETCVERYPWKTRSWIFVVDRHHCKNYKLCSAAYNMDSYKWMETINSQVCEQRNNSLRKMAKSLAHMKFGNYLQNLTLYFSYTNLKIKNLVPRILHAPHTFIC